MFEKQYRRGPGGRAHNRSVFKIHALWVATAFAAVIGVTVPQGAEAARPNSTQPGATIVIGTDYGGSVRKRAAEIRRIKSLGQRVEVRGAKCMSTCTMFVGLQDVCVRATTTFGFHGPSYYGTKLSPKDFDDWSRVIAAHYPAPLRKWYMEVGRMRVNSAYKLKGAELIQLGVPSCA